MFRRSGSSFDLKTVRDWQLSDDPRRIDWRLAARSGRLCVKEFYEEESDGAAILVDLSSSMSILDRKMGDTTTTEQIPSLEARRVGASLAWILSALGLPCLLMSFGQRPLRILDRPRPSPATAPLEAFFASGPGEGEGGTNIGLAIAEARKACRWRRLVLVSDFFDPAFHPGKSAFSRNAWIRLYRPLSDLAGDARELLVRDPESGLALRQAWDGAARIAYRESEARLESSFRESERRGAFYACLGPGEGARDLYWSFLEALHA